MDRVAEAIGCSPHEFRIKNMLREGDTTSTGQVMDESCASEEVLSEAIKRSDFEKKWKEYSKGESADIRRGIGMAFFFHGAAFTGSGEERMKGKAGLRCDPNGRITVLTACTEMGQGAHTVIPQIAADQLGLDLSCIGVETPDTSLVPNSGPTVASRTTMVMGSVLEKCAATLKGKLFAHACDIKGAKLKNLKFKGTNLTSGGGIVMAADELVKSYVAKHGVLAVIDHFELPPHIKWDEDTYKGDAYPTYAWGCDVAEVEVDMTTFEIKVMKMWLAQDVGKAINPKMAEGQIEGGTLQALGYALMERHSVDKGRVLTNRLQTYIIPTFQDTPEMETILVEKPFEHGPMGAKGIGELPMDGGAPAIANAIANATGLRVCELPITPEVLYEQWLYERRNTK